MFIRKKSFHSWRANPAIMLIYKYLNVYLNTTLIVVHSKLICFFSQVLIKFFDFWGDGIRVSSQYTIKWKNVMVTLIAMKYIH